jgi:hypothetical protein
MLCINCNIDKELSEFSKNIKRKSGYQIWCKSCHASNLKTWRESNRDAQRVWGRKNYNKNRDKYIASMTKWRESNRDYFKQYQREHLAENCAKVMRRYANKLKATPPWMTSEQNKEIETFYKVCKWLNDWKLETYNVDHIIPLQGKNVCGLHVPWNLQILTEYENKSKGNMI